VAATDQEFVDLVYRVIGQQDAKESAQEIERAVEHMTDAQRNGFREAGAAARKAAQEQQAAAHAASMAAQQQKREIDQLRASWSAQHKQQGITLASVFYAVELFRRLTGVLRQAGAALQEVIQHNANLTREYDRATGAAGEFLDALADGAEAGGHLSHALRDIQSELRGMAGEARTAGSALDLVVGAFNALRPHSIGQFIGSQWVPGFGAASQVTEIVSGGAEDDLRARQQSEDRRRVAATNAEVARAQRGLDAAQARLGDRGTGLETPSVAALRGPAGEQLYMSEAAAYESRQRKERAERASEQASRGAEAAARDAQRAELERLEAIKEALDKVTEGYLEQVEANRAMLDASWDMDRQDAQEEQELVSSALELQRSRDEEEHQAHLRRLDDYRREKDALDKDRESELQRSKQRISDMQSYAGSFITVGGAIGDVFGQLADREEEGSEAAKRYGKIQGGIMAAISFIESAIEYASGIASIGQHDYVAAASHFAAGIAYDVAGAMAIAQLGGDAQPASTGGSASAGTYVAEQPTGDEGTGQPSGAYVQILTMGGTSARLGQEMLRAERDLQRAGLDSPMLGGGSWS